MVKALIVLLSVLVLALIALVFVLLNKIKQTNRTLRELIKENDGQQSNPGKTSGDIYFKINKDFVITFINENGADMLGYESCELLNRSVFETLIEDTEGNRETLSNVLSKMCRNQSSINTQIVLIRKDGKKQLMQCRERPLLDEILECEGISFLCKDLSEAKAWKENLSQFENRDILISGLNEDALFERFEHDFKLAQRYNKPFSCLTVEMKDVYDFISRGIDFETADKMLKNVGDICFANLTPNANIGRVDKTKIVLVLNATAADKAFGIAEKISEQILPAVRALGIDEYNAAMFVIAYAAKKNYTDTSDALWTRMRRHVKQALKKKEYRIIDADNERI